MKKGIWRLPANPATFAKLTALTGWTRRLVSKVASSIPGETDGKSALTRSDTGSILGLTAWSPAASTSGRATASRQQFNSEVQLAARREWMRRGLFQQDAISVPSGQWPGSMIPFS